MNVTPEQLKQLFDGGFISTDDYHAALMEYVKSKYDKEFFDGRSINPNFVSVPLSEDDLASIGCAMYEKPHPEWLHAYLKWKKSHTVNCSDEHEVPYEAGYAEGVRKTAESHNKQLIDISRHIKRIAGYLENCDSKIANSLLLHLLKDIP